MLAIELTLGHRTALRGGRCIMEGMSAWGRTTYGDPCRECGFTWSLGQDEVAQVIAAIPDRFTAALNGTDGTARLPDLAWSALGYVCHVTDNLRIWAERLAAAALRPTTVVISPYDADLLAEARAYAGVPIEGALWSLRRVVGDWLVAFELANAADAHLLHPDRGEQQVIDIGRSNAHDAIHHEWDILRSVAAAE